MFGLTWFRTTCSDFVQRLKTYIVVSGRSRELDRSARSRLLSVWLCAGLLAEGATAQAAPTLVGRATLPAETFAPGPTSGRKVSAANGIAPPFEGKQPVQGVSAVVPGPRAGTYFVLLDNGFGARENSPDFSLRIYAVEPDFSSGRVWPVDARKGQRLERFDQWSFLALRDPKGQLPFPLHDGHFGAAPATAEVGAPPRGRKMPEARWLSGADLDPESFRQLSDGTFWLGDEFGPFLVHVDASGVLLEAPVALPNLLRSGTNPWVQSPQNPRLDGAGANLGASRGFEGLAMRPDGARLYALLEGPVRPGQGTADAGTDGTGDARRLLVHEFDPKARRYTGNLWSYLLESPTHAIGDFTAVNEREFLVLERDNGQGDARNPAFESPARFKKLFWIRLPEQRSSDAGPPAPDVEKRELVDLLALKDPRGLGGEGTREGVFAFAYQTIESVLPLDARTLLIVNDNNFPFSAGRRPGVPDDTEFILVRLDEPLKWVAPMRPRAPALRAPSP